MGNIIIVLVLVLIIGAAGIYIYNTKKKGQKCIGCPYARECANKSNCACNK